LCLTCLIFIVGHSNAEPLLDEDTESDTSIPNRMVTEDDDRQTLRQITDTPSIVDWAEQNVGDIYRKEKTKGHAKEGQRKEGKDDG
jgi:hypothetical protein